MPNQISWIGLASSILLAACENPAPHVALASAGSAAPLGNHVTACELAQRPARPDSGPPQQHARGLFMPGQPAGDTALPYTGRLASAAAQLSGSYALRVSLDVYTLEEGWVAPERDPGRGSLNLLLRAELTPPTRAAQAMEAELRLCGLELPPSYAYATSSVTQWIVPNEVWDRAQMPVFTSRPRVSESGDAISLELAAFPILLGISLTEPGAAWPSYEQTPTFACGADRSGSACFPDHDGDGEPGVSLRVKLDGEVTDAPYPACHSWKYAAPSTDAEAWLAAPDVEMARMFVGLRTALNISLNLDESYSEGSGEVVAEDVLTRVLDCELSDARPCSANQAATLDARAAKSGAAWYEAGQLARAVEFYDRAAAIARQQHDHLAAAEAVGAASFVLRGTVLFDRRRHRQIRDALRALPDGDSGIKAMLLPVSTLGEHSPGALAQRQAAADEGIAMARRLGEPSVLAQALSSSHYGLWGAAPPNELFGIASELLDIARELGDAELLLDALLWRMSDSLELGDGETLALDNEEYLALLDGHHSGWHRYMAAILQSLQECCLGNFARADMLSLRASALGEQQQESSAQPFLAVRELFRRLDGRVAPADAAVPLDPPSDLPVGYHQLWLLGWVRFGREHKARAALAAAAARGFETLPLDPLRRPTLVVLAMCAAELNEPAHARALYALLQGDASLHVVLQPGVYLGPVHYVLGALAASLDDARAGGHFEAALAGCGQARSRSFLWKVQLAYAQWLMGVVQRGHGSAGQRGQPALARARQLLSDALQLSAELDCDPWRARTQALLQAFESLAGGTEVSTLRPVALRR